jgi:hypothetical protein
MCFPFGILSAAALPYENHLKKSTSILKNRQMFPRTGFEYHRSQQEFHAGHFQGSPVGSAAFFSELLSGP